MAPGIPLKSNRKADASQKMVAGTVDPRTQQLMQMMREVRKNVEANAEYVGDRFADEARKIHYAESEKRGIYGEAKPEDAKALIEEGIEVIRCRDCRKIRTKLSAPPACNSHPCRGTCAIRWQEGDTVTPVSPLMAM